MQELGPPVPHGLSLSWSYATQRRGAPFALANQEAYRESGTVLGKMQCPCRGIYAIAPLALVEAILPFAATHRQGQEAPMLDTYYYLLHERNRPRPLLGSSNRWTDRSYSSSHSNASSAIGAGAAVYGSLVAGNTNVHSIASCRAHILCYPSRSKRENFRCFSRRSSTCRWA
jgi:hypothetical protein